MRKSDILFICDFETTGIDPDMDYPIELGGLFVDIQLNILGIVDFLIKPPESLIVELFIKRGENNYRYYGICWHSEAKEAYKVHGIDPELLLSEGKEPTEAVDILLSKINALRPRNGRIIITSDNAQFEFNFMKRLFRLAGSEENWPFHYCAWDTNLCLEFFSDVGDPVPAHRAFLDACRLYRQLVRYAERVGFFRKEGLPVEIY